MFRSITTLLVAGAAVAGSFALDARGTADDSPQRLAPASAPTMRYGSESIDGLDVFFRSAS